MKLVNLERIYGLAIPYPIISMFHCDGAIVLHRRNIALSVKELYN